MFANTSIIATDFDRPYTRPARIAAQCERDGADVKYVIVSSGIGTQQRCVGYTFSLGVLGKEQF
jgi:hypothetical protein